MCAKADTVAIKDIKSLGEASATLHDARVSPGGIAFDRASRTLVVQAWQNTARYPAELWEEWCLGLEGIRQVRRWHDDPSDYPFYEIATLKYVPDCQLLIVMTHYDLAIFARCPILSGHLSRTGRRVDCGDGSAFR